MNTSSLFLGLHISVNIRRLVTQQASRLSMVSSDYKSIGVKPSPPHVDRVHISCLKVGLIAVVLTNRPGTIGWYDAFYHSISRLYGKCGWIDELLPCGSHINV